MTSFRVLLVVLGSTVLVYTVMAVANEGVNLFATTLPALADFGWPGQFHLDFATYLLLSGLWVAWRHQFSTNGILLGILASLLGIIFLSVYLLVAISKANGNISEVLLGQQPPNQGS